MTLLTDDDLDRLLAGAAALAPEPESGPPALGGDAEHRAPTRRVPRWLPAAAVVLVALLLGRVVLDDAGQEQTRADSGGVGTAGASESFPIPAYEPQAALPTPLERTSPESGAVPVSGTVGGSAATGSPASGAAGAAAPLDPSRIVHAGSVEVEVADGAFGPTVERVTALATGLGGHVSASQTSEQGDAPRGTVTVRVPAAAFEQLLGEVRRLGEVHAVATSGTDITAQYTDLEARIGALRASHDQLLTVLTQARSIPDILAVRDHLTRVQLELDSLEGQRRLLEDRSAFGTLAITVVEPGTEDVAPLPAAGDGGLGGAWDEARRGFGDAVEWLVARSGKALVLAAVALALYGLGVMSLRHLRRRAI